MIDYKEGIKKEVAEIKFLIHDLRVERFINEVIHFHVTLNTDLEIFGINQAQVLHGEDLQDLKTKAVNLRKAYGTYSNAVKSFSPDKTVFVAGKAYVQAILDICELILNPLWGRIESVLSFLPDDSRSVRSRSHYRNCLRFIAEVRTRIEHFLDEQQHRDVVERFDIAEDIEDFTRNVVYGYVTEKSGGRVEPQLERLDSAIVEGNRHRFRRMFFNLVMNAVDAMGHLKLGILNISDVVEGDQVILRVSDNGTGMTPEKIKQLLTDKKTLDGELHSLGFVFVRQTVIDLKGDLSIESEIDKGTTLKISLPYLKEASGPGPQKAAGDIHIPAPPITVSLSAAAVSSEVDSIVAPPVSADWKAAPAVEEQEMCGELILHDFARSESDFPGSIFAMGVNEEDRIDFFAHQPYERYWNITHEDLSPMFFQATIRGRLEEDDEKKPVLILKAPHSAVDYFHFREIPESGRNPERFSAMIHDEYIKIARKLLATGLPSETGVHLTGAHKYFATTPELFEVEPVPLDRLASQPLTTEPENR